MSPTTLKTEIKTDFIVVKNGSDGVDGLQGPKGDQGVQGPQGLPGEDGVDGASSYTHIAYANNESGTTDFSVSDPTGRAYIGIYVDQEATDSTNPADYRWSLIKGADGENGLPGPPGEDGQTPYFHVAYATSADGTTGFSTTVSTGKTYIGTYTDFTQADSTNPSKYKWVAFKGEDGEDAKNVSMFFPKGNVFRNSSPDDTLTATVQFYVGGTLLDESQFGVIWFYQDASVTSSSSPNYHSAAGLGWALINSNNTLNSSLSGFSTKTLTIKNSAVDGSRVFRAIVNYGANSYSTTFNILDVADTVQVAIEGGLNFFKGSTEVQTLKARVFKAEGEILALTGYVFDWSFFDKDGVLIYKPLEKTQTITFTPSALSSDTGYVTCEVSN